MSAETQAIFAEWRLPPGLTLGLLLVTALYVRGWIAIRKTRSAYFTDGRLFCFLAGMAVLWLSVASPLDGVADVLLSAHMVQHLMLMSVVPPLVLLGAPVVPLLRGLPAPIIQKIVGPLLATAWVRKTAHFLTQPATAWVVFNLTFLGWHFPRAYDLALEHEKLHAFEHICFLGTSILFWWVVLRPWPARRNSAGWMVLVYLLSADVVNTALSAFLAFCNHIVYPYYSSGPNPFHVDPLADQVLGAVIMWVPGSLIFLVPAMLLTVRMMEPQRGRARVAAGSLPS